MFFVVCLKSDDTPFVQALSRNNKALTIALFMIRPEKWMCA